MLWIAFYCPTLPLDRIHARMPAAMRPALAVTDQQDNRPRVVLANDQALAAGVRSGQPVATALAIVPDLLLLERQPLDEAKALQELACCLLRYTPSVVIQPNGIVAEISASLRLFGGRPALIALMVQTVKDQGLVAQAATAPTFGAAWLLALHGRKPQPTAPAASFEARLDALPVHLLEAAQVCLADLHGIGCKTLGDLQGLPRKGLARRFGENLLSELDRAYGRQPDPQIWFETPEQFAAKLELLARVETVEALLFAINRMIGQLTGWLSARQAAAVALTFLFRHDARGRTGKEPTVLTIRLAEASNDPQHLMGLFRERLDRMTLVAPVEELELKVDELAVKATPNTELFPSPQSHASSLNRLIEKLTARLGHEAVRQIQSHADHRPEKAQQIVACQQAPSQQGLLPIRDAPRPVWLMPSPLALTMLHDKPFYQSTLQLLTGPERIESGWWDDRYAGRDYFMAENDDGQLLWVYRERKSVTGSGWYLHGLFG